MNEDCFFVGLGEIQLLPIAVGCETNLDNWLFTVAVPRTGKYFGTVLLNNRQRLFYNCFAGLLNPEVDASCPIIRVQCLYASQSLRVPVN